MVVGFSHFDFKKVVKPDASAHDWFLEITFVHKVGMHVCLCVCVCSVCVCVFCVCVCVCVCVSVPPGY